MSFSDWSNKKKKKTFSEWSNEKNGITEDDIAPTVSTKPTTSTKTEEKPWYQSGVFADGYQFGDVSKHILGLVSGTADDVAPYVVGVNNDKKNESAITDNGTENQEDSLYIMNYKPGVDGATRQSIYDANAKRIAEIDAQLARTESGKTSFWQSTNPIGWVADKLSDSTKALEEERKKLVEANAQYDKYGNAVDLSYDELIAKRDAADDNADRLYYLSLANQRKLSDNAELMANTKMDGTDHSVYEELQQIATMENGEEKEKRKAAAIKKMESLGVNVDDYALYSDDENFSWGTFFDWLGNTAMSGLASFNKGLTSTVDLLLGQPLQAMGWENNPISSMAQYYSDSYDNYKFDANLLAEKLGGGKGYEYAGAAIEGTTGALPNAILALMTSGASLGGTGVSTTSSLATKAAYESGNILTKAGLTTSAMAKNPQYWLSFAQTYGTDYEEAKSKGADDFTAAFGATLSSLINAGIEIGIDGGSGFQGLPDKVAKGDKNAIFEWLKSGIEEGGEEGAQKLVNEVITKYLYDHDAEILNPVEYATEMGIGTLSGLALGGGQIAVQSGTNAITNAIQEHEAKKLTETEQKVFDKVFEDRIAEESENGEVTNKRKKEIREEILNEMEKGYLSTDTIEEVLAGDSYKAYKDNVANEEALRKEYDELYNMKNGDKSSAQVDREAELKKMLEEIDNGTTRSDLRSKLNDEVFGIIKGSRLANSYIDSDNRKRKYADDATKYTNKYAKTTIENAIKSGVVNNSNRAHEMTETLTKLSSDQNVVYDFVNDKIIESQGRKKKVKATKTFTADGTTTEFDLNTTRMDSSVKPVVKVGNTVVDNYTVDYKTGKIVFDSAPQKGKITVDYGAFGRINGWIETLEDGTKKITLNMNSNEVWQFTTGHEITHSLEGTKKYSKFRKVLYQYAKDKGDYDSLMESVKDRYEEGTDYDSELTADLVGRYLFQDEDFVKHLSVNHRNVFQWLWDEVKHLSKMVTAGSKEARQLEKVKHAFEEAYRAEGKSKTGTQYSVSRDVDGNVFVDVTEDIFDANNGESVARTIQRVISERFDNLINANGQKIQINKTTNDEFRRSESAGHFLKNPSQTYNDKLKTIANADEILTAAKNWIGEKRNHERKDDIVEFGRGNIMYRVGENGYVADVLVGIRKNGAAVLYDLVNIYDKKITEAPVTMASNENSQRRQDTSVADIVPQSEAEVNEQFSISKPVEETKELMAIHNLHTNEVLKQLDMGGLVYPSVAITDPSKIAHGDFGEVSLILKKDAIDPKNSKYNKIYSTDAYTPTFPHISYEVNRDVATRISNKVKALYGKIPQEYQRSLGYLRDDVNIDDRLNSFGGEKGMIETYENDYDMKQLYLAEKGEVVPTEIKRTETQISDVQRENYQFVVDKLGAETFDSFRPKDGYTSPMTARKQWFAQYGESLKEAYAEYWAADGTMTKEEALEIANSESDPWWMREARLINEYLRTGGTTVKEETDIAATNAKIDEKIADSDYKQWLSDLLSGIEGNSGIRNNKDTFTPSGNRRSFSQLHDPVTIDNVINAMRKKDQQGEGAFGIGNIFGASAKEYGSIAEAKKNSGELGVIAKEEYDAIKERVENRLFDIAGKYSNGKDIIDAKNTLVEAVAKYETKAQIAKFLKQYDYVYKYADSIANDLISLRDYIRSLPRPYFEAKPQRAVGFDEVAVFVIPRNADIKLKQELLNRGYSIAEYDPDVEGDRQKVVNQFEEYKFSLSDASETTNKYGNFATPMSELRYDAPTQDVAPVQETVSNTETVAPEATTQTDVAPVQVAQPDEYNSLLKEKADLERRLMQAATEGSENEAQLAEEYNALTDRINRIEADESVMQRDRFNSLTDEDAPPEIDAPYYGESETVTPDDPFANRDIKEVGNRKVKAYMYENPEVKPFFQDEARGMLGDLRSTTKGERWYNDKLYYESNGEYGWSGTKRHTTDDIAYLLDEFGYTYAEIEKGLNAIIEDNGAENNAVSKRIEFMLDERLRKGYTGVFGEPIPANQEYINLLNEKQIMEYSDEARQNFMEHADEYAPLYTEENIGQDVAQSIAPDVNENAHPVQEAPIKEEAVEDSTDPIPPEQKEKIARIRKANPKAAEGSWWTRTKKKLNNAVTLLGDKGWAIENLSKKSGNRDLEAKYDFMKNRSVGVAEEYIHDNLLPLIDKIEESGKRNPSVSVVEVDGSTISDYMEQLDYYTKHLHNIDRMSLDTEEDKARRQEIRNQLEGYTENQIQSIASEKITRNTPSDRVETIYLAREYIDLGGEKGKNKPVFGYSVTADVSRKQVEKYESVHPEFIELAQEVNAYFKELRQFAVNQGLIKQTVADKWQGMYPHYVATSRTDRQGASVSVPLDSNKTGVNNPFKRATGGNGDFEPLAETMAKNTIQIFRAVHRNGFGLELQNTLENLYGSETTKTVDDSDIDVSDILEATQENDGSVLQAGKNGKPPQFTVFVKGKRVTFDITEDIYNALKPVEGELAKTHAIPNKIAEGYKKVLTELDPFFALVRNPIKDTKDVLFNSRHAFATYSTAPKTMKEIASKGKYFTEYIKNGGKTTSYYDTKKQTFDRVDGGKWYGFPWRKYKQASENVEMFWRLSEYIASREAGESIEVAMLDSARVTTNFGAGADLTKWANRNGAMFLNPSVQGVMQNVRNVREAYHQGVKGSAILAAKVIATGLGGMFFNWLLWHDDEEYEELSEYVKQNYFCIWKTPDGKFIRIPKGRMEAVIQNGFEQMGNLITGNDDVDIETFLSLVKNNIAPNNPFENNLISPILQATSNTAWYGEELVPARLQNLPAAEQFDESTDEISKWLGKTFNISPYKVNYVLSQYGGGFADLVLPMLTNEAEGPSFFAPIADEFISDPLLKNQNVSDFYDKKDELTVNANSSKATEKDVLMSKYMNSINSELSELYKQKREIQNSSLSDAEKYEQVRDIQSQIVELTRESLNTYDDIEYHSARDGEYSSIGDRYFKLDDDGEWQKLSDDQVTKYKVTSAAGDASYASDGENHYHWYEPDEDSDAEPGWRKITEEQLEKQKEVTSGLDITPEEYWSNKDEYDYAYKYPGNYAVSKAVGSYESYRQYSSELYDIKADKDANGKSISGSRKEKVIDYLNDLDIDYGSRMILFKSEYPADDTYNYDIINYLEENNAISADDMRTILTELGLKVHDNGTITWD